MRRALLVGVAACLGAGAVAAAPSLAQAPAPARPGPEVQKLGYFVGEWTFVGENEQSPLGPAAKFSGTEKCEWFAGGFQVLCRAESTGPTGKASGLSVYAYDPETKDYTFYAIDSTGFGIFARGTRSGETWTFNWAGTMGGKPVRLRATMQAFKTFFTGRTEASLGGASLTVVAQVKETRR